MSLPTPIMILMVLFGLVPFLPTLAGFVLTHGLHAVGWSIRRKTGGRRELILARVQEEERDYRSKQNKSPKEDEDWEKVEGYATGTAPNGELPQDEEWDGVVGFFHPFCNAGGGGERVLWAAIRATQKRWPKATYVVYSGDHDVDKASMLERVENRFDIQLHPPTLIFLYLSTRHYVLPSTYPHLSLLGQSLGSLILAYDAFSLLVPDIFIDTMGYAFTLAFCHYLFPSVPTAAYIHYPTISTDMLESLDDQTGEKGVNAGDGIGWKGRAKKTYWHLFAWLYGWVGAHIDIVMCNSSWTAEHITALWGRARSRHHLPNSFPSVVFPPVAVSSLTNSIDISSTSEVNIREPSILYIAQFRPEKNHSLILRAFSKYLHSLPSDTTPKPQLILIGSVRTSPGTPDSSHIYSLRLLAHELRIRDNTSFICDASFAEIREHLSKASIGVNGMWNEHFGIGVVEYQAAGLISVVHDSGGPKEDIVVDVDGLPTGFHATTDEEFAAAFNEALSMPAEGKVKMRWRARESSQRFTDEKFAERWVRQMEELVGLQVGRTKGDGK